MVNNWLNKHKDISSLEMLDGKEGLPETEQIDMMLKNAVKFMDNYIAVLGESMNDLISDNPDLIEGFPDIQEMFIF